MMMILTNDIAMIRTMMMMTVLGTCWMRTVILIITMTMMIMTMTMMMTMLAPAG